MATSAVGAFCRETLRREGVLTVLDIAATDGTILKALCSPSSHVDSFPPLLVPAVETYPSDSEGDGGPEDSDADDRPETKLSKLVKRSPSLRRRRRERQVRKDRLRTLPLGSSRDRLLHLNRVVALDSGDEDALKNLTGELEELVAARPERWEPLRVEVWQGSVETFNEAFESVDAIIANELVQDLADLTKFAATTLGLYSPRLMIVTSTEGADTGGWSRSRLESWARKVSFSNDYDAQSGTLPPNKAAGSAATHWVIFRKRPDEEPEQRSPRSHRPTPLPFYSPSAASGLTGSLPSPDLERAGTSVPTTRGHSPGEDGSYASFFEGSTDLQRPMAPQRPSLTSAPPSYWGPNTGGAGGSKQHGARKSTDLRMSPQSPASPGAVAAQPSPSSPQSSPPSKKASLPRGPHKLVEVYILPTTDSKEPSPVRQAESSISRRRRKMLDALERIFSAQSIERALFSDLWAQNPQLRAASKGKMSDVLESIVGGFEEDTLSPAGALGLGFASDPEDEPEELRRSKRDSHVDEDNRWEEWDFEVLPDADEEEPERGRGRGGATTSRGPKKKAEERTVIVWKKKKAVIKAA